MKLIVSILLAFTVTTPVHAAWYLQYGDISSPRQKIDNSEHTFMVDGTKCVAEETKFHRFEDSGQVAEFRHLTCYLGHDIIIFDVANCNFPNFEFTNLNFQIGKSGYAVNLICGPAK